VQLVDPGLVSRGVIRVDSGEDLVESLQVLATAAGWQEAFVSGAGVLELVELDTGSGVVTLENAELTSLAGRILKSGEGTRVMLRATVTVDGVSKSGKIAAAMTGGLLLVVDAIADARVSAAAQPQKRHDTSPSPPFAAARTATPQRVVPDGSRSAAKPLSQSFKTKPIVRKPQPISYGRADDDDDNPIVNAGDFLNHPQLGLCEVVGDDDSGGTKIRISSGRSRVLKLDTLIVLPGELDDEGRNVFKIAGPRKR
jgi:predicted DNA-binding protein with PD1-like motif